MPNIKKIGPYNPQKASAYVGKGVLRKGGVKKAQKGDSTRINMRERQSMLNSLVQSNADKNKKLKDKPYFDIRQSNPSDTGRTLKDYDSRKDLEDFRKAVGQKRTGGKITKVPNGPLIKKKGRYAGSTLKNGGKVGKKSIIKRKK